MIVSLVSFRTTVSFLEPESLPNFEKLNLIWRRDIFSQGLHAELVPFVTIVSAWRFARSSPLTTVPRRVNPELIDSSYILPFLTPLTLEEIRTR